MGKGASTKGFIKNLSTGIVRKFIFNPESFSDDVTVMFSEIGNGGGAGKKYQYVGSDNRNITVELYLKGSTLKINEFKNFLEDFIPRKKFTAPPILLYCFGSYIKKCIMLSMSREWRDFNTNLEVKEIIIKLSLKEVS